MKKLSKRAESVMNTLAAFRGGYCYCGTCKCSCFCDTTSISTSEKNKGYSSGQNQDQAHPYWGASNA
ncbi:MAG: CLI_3235 family bacteriocin precursor [Clostridia bacterium]